MALTHADAKAFADRWFSAWNAARPDASGKLPPDRLDAIMSCYDESIEHSSPFIARFNGTNVSTLRGRAVVGEYFRRALENNPTPPGVTRFQPLYVTTGQESVLVVYRRMTGEIAGEVFFLNGAGKVVRSVSHYG